MVPTSPVQPAPVTKPGGVRPARANRRPASALLPRTVPTSTLAAPLLQPIHRGPPTHAEQDAPTRSRRQAIRGGRRSRPSAVAVNHRSTGPATSAWRRAAEYHRPARPPGPPTGGGPGSNRLAWQTYSGAAAPRPPRPALILKAPRVCQPSEDPDQGSQTSRRPGRRCGPCRTGDQTRASRPSAGPPCRRPRRLPRPPARPDP